MTIKSITIRNFRSISSETIELDQLNVFTGSNDVGKSNILKALNLFFNNQTSLGEELDFVSDFSDFHKTRARRAQEIEITLRIQPPSNFSFNSEIEWTKKWRRAVNTPHLDYCHPVGQEKFPPKSKVDSWARSIRYHYIPANKDKQYFQHLLKDLHDTLLATAEMQLNESSNSFIRAINGQTKHMLIDLKQVLGFPVQITMPNRLDELFKTLEFRDTHSKKTLNLRGDGIKVRHIPSILTFLEQKQFENATKGSPRASHIWGYEEPENNLEFSTAFEFAEQLLSHSTRRQLLVTTHSPIFYKTAKNQNAKCFFALRKEDDNSTKVIDHTNQQDELDINMGVLPFIAPYIAEKVSEIKNLRNKYTNIPLGDFILTEGTTDAIIFKALLSTMDVPNKPIISGQKLSNQDQSSSVNERANDIIALSSLNKKNFIVIFDADEAAKIAKGKLPDKAKSHVITIKELKDFRPTDNLRENSLYDFQYSIEECLPSHIWEQAKKITG